MKKENQSTAQAELCREYGSLRGMSLSGEPCPLRRFAYTQNMYVDRESGGDAVESIPGFREFHKFNDAIHSLGVQMVENHRFLLVHSGEGLYRLDLENADESLEPTKIADLQNCESHLFTFGSLALITDGSRLLSIDKEGEATTISEEDYLTGCSLCALYDGRIFMSGNPDYPERIFFSSKPCEDTPCFYQTNLLRVNKSGASVISLLSYGGMLWVFKSYDDGDGSVILYKTNDEGYCLCRTYSDFKPTGQLCSADGKIIFLTEEGLFAIENPLCDERAFVKRLSRDIEPELLREDLRNASLTFWRGYIAIGCGENIYLCDTESEDGYDWYLITGVGGYENDRRVYRYSAYAEEGYFLHPRTNQVTESEALSIITEDKRRIYYTIEDKKKYAVYPTEQFDGGDFLPARRLISDGRLLLFYSDDGRIFIFNTDKRGIIPQSIMDSTDFDEKEYKRLYGDRIHPMFYSFDRHAPKYMLVTHSDGCGISDLVKSSDGSSLTLRLKVMNSKPPSIEIFTDGRRHLNQDLTKSATQPTEISSEERKFLRRAEKYCVIEHAPSWQEKQICLYTEEFSSPFGLLSISFRYQPKDKIKKG